jgi:hypothetical protein
MLLSDRNLQHFETPQRIGNQGVLIALGDKRLSLAYKDLQALINGILKGYGPFLSVDYDSCIRIQN